MRKNIAIVAGGNSGESEISMNSAKVIQENIDNEKYNVFTIYIKGALWIYKTVENKDINVDKNDFSITVNNEKINFDCVFIAIHGTPGEDGKLQGYFDLLNIPYTSSSLLTSALTFNKKVCTTLVSTYGAYVAKSIVVSKQKKLTIEQILSEINLPCFAKPNNGGSSIGTSKVNKIEDLQKAIDEALAQDSEVIIEEFIEGTEITCGVVKSTKEILVLPITEIVPKTEFFDYEAKYKGASEEITPARISKEIEAECKRISLDLYKKLNCSGMSRFDYIISKDKLFFLEVNTVPGLSENSIVPQQAKAIGISAGELYTMVIEDALNRK
jgi:D-alanine-D-alanine ligase